VTRDIRQNFIGPSIELYQRIAARVVPLDNVRYAPLLPNAQVSIGIPTTLADSKAASYAPLPLFRKFGSVVIISTRT
jgi:hypothetical protein